MDFSKHSLKDLIKIVRLNKKHSEVTQGLGIKDLRFAKKKPLANYMNSTANDYPITEAEQEPEQIEDDKDNTSYQDSPLRPDEIEEQYDGLKVPQRQNVIEINLDNIKTKKKPVKEKVVLESPEEIEQKRVCMELIERYYSRFPWLEQEPIDLSNPIRALEIIKCKVASKNTSELISQNFFALCSGAESLAVNTPSVNQYFKIQGFTQNLRANQAAQDVLDELIIKYTPSVIGEGGLPVEARFGLIILGCLYQTHQVNLLTQQTQEIKNKPVDRSRFTL